MAVIAIGDIHGYADKFYNMMNALVTKGHHPMTDQFVFLGDYIDGGPRSKEVVYGLRLIQSFAPHTVFLKGNHEDLMLDALIHCGRRYLSYDLWWNQGGRETFESYKREYRPDITDDYQRFLLGPRDVIPDDDLQWLDNLPTMWENQSCYFVHGGFTPGIEAKYTDEETRLWIRDKFIYSQYDWGKYVIFGHTYHEEPWADGRKFGIDTMHHGGGKLTAMIMNDPAPDDAFVYEYVHV